MNSGGKGCARRRSRRRFLKNENIVDSAQALPLRPHRATDFDAWKLRGGVRAHGGRELGQVAIEIGACLRRVGALVRTVVGTPDDGALKTTGGKNIGDVTGDIFLP